MRRRDFLKRAGCFVASAAVPTWIGCGDDEKDDDRDAGDGGAEPGYSFPHGVASGDPQPNSVMLWTRVSGGDGPVKLKLEVSTSESFGARVISKSIDATEASDYTVRVLCEDLAPNTIYYYRFRAGTESSRVGRTRTAPERDAEVDVRFVWVSCQDYTANFYGSYRQLLNDDAKLDPAEQVQFVLHLGDFIYETRNAEFMQALNDDLERVSLESKAGKPRTVGAFPSGGKTNAGTNYANTVADYRHIYKTYLTDRDLQDARARWPFICVWDDHEFTNDAWQTQANYDRNATTDEPSQRRRVAASQAWFEYIPSALSDLETASETPKQARDFEPTSVEDAAYTDVITVSEPNNQRAIGAITIYRNLRWGKHVELVLTDCRSYRSDHALSEDLTKSDLFIFHPRAAVPMAVVNTMDAGRTANGGMPPETFGMPTRFVNTRKDSPPGTMLGDEQKQWWKDVMASSAATWRVWGNPVPLLRIQLDGSMVDIIKDQLLLSADAWDGYNTERKELMAFLKERNIHNVVSLSGDHHAHYAGLVHDDYDGAQPSPVMLDFATGAISSTSQFAETAGAFDTSVPESLKPVAAGVRRVIVYDATEFGGDKAVANMNTLIRYGSRAANEAAGSNDLAKIEAARDPSVNPHLRYADSTATGYGLAHATAQRLELELVTVERSYVDLGDQSPGIAGTATFTVPHVESFADLKLDEPRLEGKKPFPLR
jgi:alkaline phosphatase D